MRCGIAAAMVMLVFAGCGRKTTMLDRWVAQLAESAPLSNQAGREGIVRYFDERPSERRSIGKRLLEERTGAEGDVAARINRLLSDLSEIAEVKWRTDEDRVRMLGPDYSDALTHIDTVPVMVIVITSRDMLAFYRQIAQRNRRFTHPMPEPDMEGRLLLGVLTTAPGRKDSGWHIRPTILNYACRRNFDRGLTECRLTLTLGGPSDTTGSIHPGVGGVDYDLSHFDLPFVIRHSWDKSPEVSSFAEEHRGSVMWLRTYGVPLEGPLVVIDPTDREPSWDESARVLQGRNIWALRRLAEECDASVPKKVRRDFLQKGFMVDPLLPYVLFTTLAAKSPEAFLDDHEYWKTRAPESAVVGELFKGALAEGKRIANEGRPVEEE